MEERDRRDSSYRDDVHGWSLRQAELLRAGRLDDVDVENVAEEIEGVARPQATSLESCYRLVAGHLLKVLYQPERLTRSRQATVVRERFNAAAHLRDDPSLEPRGTEVFGDAFRQAHKLAAAETGLPLKSFPVDPPFTLDEMSSEDDAPRQVPET